MSAGARNVLVIVALAAAVAFVPGGGHTASFVGAVFSTAILATFVLLAMRFYRENRVAIFSLGDRHRALLYGGIGLAVVAMAARQRLFDAGGGGMLAWFVMIGAAGAALFAVWRHHRSYGY